MCVRADRVIRTDERSATRRSRRDRWPRVVVVRAPPHGRRTSLLAPPPPLRRPATPAAQRLAASERTLPPRRRLPTEAPRVRFLQSAHFISPQSPPVQGRRTDDRNTSSYPTADVICRHVDESVAAALSFQP